MEIIGLLLHHHALRALVAGVVYMVLYIVGSRILWGVRRPRGLRPSQPGWPLATQVAGLMPAVGFLFALLLDGAFTTNDIGLGPVDWPIALPWVLLITGGAMVWLVLLWGINARRQKAQAAPAILPRWGGWASILIHVLQQEAHLAVFRGALMPLAGSYWGAWLSVLWKLLTSHTNPARELSLRQAGRRELVFLDWALDWVSTALFVFSGSLWAMLAGRLLCYLAVLGVLRLTRRAPPPTRADDLTDQQRQGDQRGEHGSSDQADALQIP